MPVLHQMQMSGNCYKVRLAARQLGVQLTLKDYGLHDGATRKPEFLARNPRVHAEGRGGRSTRGGTGSSARGSTQRSGTHFLVYLGQGGSRARVRSRGTTQSEGHPESRLVRIWLS